MGNSCTSRDKAHLTLNSEEIKALDRFYDAICYHNGSKNGNEFHFKALSQIFEPSQLTLAKGLYKAMQDDKYKAVKQKVVYSSYSTIVEILVKENKFLKNEELRKFGKIGVVCYLLQLGRNEEIVDIKKQHILIPDAIEHLSIILGFFDRSSNKTLVMKELGPKAIVDAIFESDSVSVPWLKFVFYVRSLFPWSDKPIINYFRHLFMKSHYSKKPVAPALDHPTRILTNEQLSLLYLSNPMLQNIEKIHLLYTGSIYDEAMTSIIEVLQQYKSPIIILFRHNYDNESYHLVKAFRRQAIIGACLSTLNQNQNQNLYTNVFALSPKFQNILLDSQSHGTSHLNINSFGSEQSISFGYAGSSHVFHISNQNDKSKILNENLGESKLLEGVEMLNIDFCEIWGLGSENFAVKDLSKISVSGKHQKPNYQSYVVTDTHHDYSIPKTSHHDYSIPITSHHDYSIPKTSHHEKSHAISHTHHDDTHTSAYLPHHDTVRLSYHDSKSEISKPPAAHHSEVHAPVHMDNHFSDSKIVTTNYNFSSQQEEKNPISHHEIKSASVIIERPDNHTGNLHGSHEIGKYDFKFESDNNFNYLKDSSHSRSYVPVTHVEEHHVSRPHTPSLSHHSRYSESEEVRRIKMEFASKK